MAFALSSSLKGFIALQSCPSSQTNRFLAAGTAGPSSLLLPRLSLSSSALAFSRRRNRNSDISSKKKKKKSTFVEDAREEVEDEEMDVDDDDDAFEALFNMLEEDLKNDNSPIDDDNDDDITEEDIEKLQHAFEVALGINEDEDVETPSLDVHDAEHDDNDEEEEEERPVKLKNWQMRRLARALKNGRRKTSIKSLAAELCLDRAIVLELLRDPPPNLVMMSAALRDEPEPMPLLPEAKPIEAIPLETRTVDDVNSETEKNVPVHVMRHSWTAQKRLKKVQVDTLERVYKRTKRPTNAMISSIIQVTNLPRKRVVKWFEDKRNEDGIPEQRLPYQRSAPEAVSSC